MGNSIDGVQNLNASVEGFGSPKHIKQMKEGIENIKEGMVFVGNVLDEAEQINKHLAGLGHRSLYSARHFQRKPKEKDDKKRENMFRLLKLLSDSKVRGYREAAALLELQEEFPEKELQEVKDVLRECGSVEATKAYMGQECSICFDTYPIPQMVSMLHCQCQCCENCIVTHFTLKIREQSIYTMSCPICGKPEDLDTNEYVAWDYFSNLQILLRNKLKQDIYELFDHKLLQETLKKQPNFKWCGLCDNGMLIDNLAERRMTCDSCRKDTCWECKKPWERLHAGRSCADYENMKREVESEDIRNNLAADGSGIQCPQCKVYYELARGGCMHFTCANCRFEFCSGCDQQFHKKRCAKCRPNATSGLKAHHPRNCMFYLRDYETRELEYLLQRNGINYNNTGKRANQRRCLITETKDNMDEKQCGARVYSHRIGLCEKHYKEHLSALIFRNRIDPVDIFTDDNLKAVIGRANVAYPPTASRQQLMDIIRRQIPLEN